MAEINIEEKHVRGTHSPHVISYSEPHPMTPSQLAGLKVTSKRAFVHQWTFYSFLFVPQLQAAFLPVIDRHALAALPRRPPRLHHQRHCDGRVWEDLHLGRFPLSRFKLAPGYCLFEGAAGEPTPLRSVYGILNGVAAASRAVDHQCLSLPDEVLGHVSADAGQEAGYWRQFGPPAI